MKKKRWISGVLIAVIAVLGVIAWFVLPLMAKVVRVAARKKE
ncbi:MAG: hypothetical protein PUB51_08220 [Oscillospiraceae bacterium]|nr:hypothetical protein [Oscillospiraceae bacterium]